MPISLKLFGQLRGLKPDKNQSTGCDGVGPGHNMAGDTETETRTWLHDDAGAKAIEAKWAGWDRSTSDSVRTCFHIRSATLTKSCGFITLLEQKRHRCSNCLDTSSVIV